jgi:glycosyltransferase A (GT-A) superfamily protein (DUF2064 family)
MSHLLIVLAHDPTVRPAGNELMAHLGAAAADLYAAFLCDSVALAGQVSRADTTIVQQDGSSLASRAPRPAGCPEVVTTTDMQPATLARLVAQALLSGPVVLLGGDLPHLPLWRLRDTLTHLEGGADVVIGPGERGNWYLIGLRSAHPALLRAIPGQGEPPDDLCIAAATHGLHVVQLPAWYTLDSLADLERLSTDLRTMPRDSSPHTRAILNGEDVYARAVGG